MRDIEGNSWSNVNNNGQTRRSSASWEIFGGIAVLPWLFILLFVVAPFVFGCSTAKKFAQHSKNAEEAIEEGEDLLQAGERLADQGRETGRSVEQLTPERSCVEAKNTEERFQVNARLVGTDQRYTLSLNEYHRFDMSGGWFTDQHTFTIEMETFDKKTGEFKTRAQTIENNFDRYQVTKRGCGILYFTADGGTIEGLSKPSKTNLR